jgi:hypothetical protein
MRRVRGIIFMCVCTSMIGGRGGGGVITGFLYIFVLYFSMLLGSADCLALSIFLIVVFLSFNSVVPVLVDRQMRNADVSTCGCAP